MDTDSKFRQLLESLGGIKLNIKAQDDRKRTDSGLVAKNIQFIEQVFNMPVPKEFLACISETGAFSFKSSVNIRGNERIPVADKNNRVSADNVFDFYDDPASVKFALDSFKENIPNHVMPICEGEPGDLIVLDMSETNHGKVLYWYHEHSEESDGLYPLANDFYEFIARLSNTIEDQAPQEGVSVSKVSDKFLERLKKSGKI